MANTAGRVKLLAQALHYLNNLIDCPPAPFTEADIYLEIGRTHEIIAAHGRGRAATTVASGTL